MKYVIGRYFVVIQLNELYISLIKYLILVRVINDLLQLSSDLYLIIIDKLNLSTINRTHLSIKSLHTPEYRQGRVTVSFTKVLTVVGTLWNRGRPKQVHWWLHPIHKTVTIKTTFANIPQLFLMLDTFAFNNSRIKPLYLFIQICISLEFL